MIVKYIRDLLKDNDRVIIPDFGAFLISKGEVRSIIFNEFIKFNDGQLINYMAEKEGFPISDASERVDDFVSKIKSDLGKAKKVDFEGIGSLFTDEQGRIRFTSIESQVVEADSLENDDKPKKKEEKKKPADNKEKKVETKTGKKEEPKKEKTEEKKQDKKIVPPVTPVKEEKKQVQAEKKQQAVKKEKPAEKPPVKEPETKKEKPAKEKIVQQDPRIANKKEDENDKEKRKRRALVIWLLVILIPLIAIAVWVILDYDNVKGYFVSDNNSSNQQQTEQTITSQDQNNQDSKTEDKTSSEGDNKAGDKAKAIEKETKDTGSDNLNKETESTKVTKQEDKAQPKKTSELETGEDEMNPLPAKEYHIIAGVFTEKYNALNKIQDLEDMGFYGKVVAHLNNKYYVSFNSFKNKPDAIYELNRLLDKGYEAWLFYY